MKKIIILLMIFGLLSSTNTFSQNTTLNWKLANEVYTSGSPGTYAFDVLIQSGANVTMKGVALSLSYSDDAFLLPLATNISVDPAFAAIPVEIGIDAANNRINLSGIDFFGTGVPLNTSEVLFCSIVIDVENPCETVGIAFDDIIMGGGSFYSPFIAFDNNYVNDWTNQHMFTPTTTKWTGAEDSDWDNPGNWDNCVPGPTSAVIIPDVTTVKALAPVAGVDVTLTDLTIEPNGALTVEDGFTLTVTGDLLIESTDAGTGSLIHSNAGLAGSIQRNLKGWGSYPPALQGGHGWHLLSSPVSAQAIAPFQNLAANDDFMKWNELANVWKNRRQGGGSIIPDPAFDATFGVGDSYLVAYEDDKHKVFEGNINVADVSVNGLKKSGNGNYYGHHAVGNPFASALEWNNGVWGNLTILNIASHIQLWNEANASYTTLDPSDPQNPNYPNGIIPAMQGFFVYTTDVSPEGTSLTIPASARVHSSQAYYKEAPQQILLTAHDLDHQLKQESKIRFNENATEGFDLQYDSYYMAGYAPQFFSVADGAAFALNTLPAMTEELVIPFTFVKNDGSNFEITLDATLDYGTIYLFDQKTNVTVNLTQSGSYSFVSEEGDDVNRFLLKFGTVGIDDPATGEASIGIFAAGNVLHLDAQQPGDATVSVYDLLGRTVLTSKVQMSPSATVDVSGLSGTFIVRAIANGEVVSTKVFIR